MTTFFYFWPFRILIIFAPVMPSSILTESMQESSGSQISNQLKLLIFDLDGTLYDQIVLKRILMRKLFFRFLSFRFSLWEFRIIRCFRIQREARKNYFSPLLKDEQYEWCANILGKPVSSIRKCIETYMYNFPLTFIKKTKFKGVDEFFFKARERKVKIAIYSDYPIEDKLKVLDLVADSLYCSTQETINQFKPSSKALELICKHAGCEPKYALYIGDRDDTDGEGARMTGIPFIKVDRKLAAKGIFYSNLTKQFNEL